MQYENFNRLVDEHRRNWPVERIVTDLDAFRADCARVLRHVRGFEAEEAERGLSSFWIRMMFGSEAGDQLESGPQQSAGERH